MGSVNDNLNPDQFPRITGSRRQYGTTSVSTEPHRAPNPSGTQFDIEAYHWHDGDSTPRYIEAEGPMIKKDGTHGNRTIRDLRQPPEHVLAEMKRLRGE